MTQTDRVSKLNCLKLSMLGLLLATSPVSLLAALVQGSDDQTLIVALSVRQETQCMGTKYRDVEANLAFTNTSSNDIVIKRGAGQNITVLGLFGTRTLRPLLSSWMSMSDQGAKATEVTIHPGDTFAYRFSIRLDAEVLKQPGFYKVQVNYNAFLQPPAGTNGNAPRDISGETNGAIFRVRECDAPKAGGAGSIKGNVKRMFLP